MISRRNLVDLVLERAQGRCEYCKMHQSLQGATFHIEHVIPKSHGGTTALQNLALACPGCNLKKSNSLDAPDPATGISTRLFHPRRDLWANHFKWDGIAVVPMTDIGRATCLLLEFNRERRLRIREAEMTFGLFPPDNAPD